MKKNLTRILITIVALTYCIDKTYSQSKLSLEPAISLNTLFLSDYPTGIGLHLDINYAPTKKSFFSLALRPKFANYIFNNNSSISSDNEGNTNSYNKSPKLTYDMFVPQIGLVPKLFYNIDNDITIFLENDIAFARINGNIKYIDQTGERREKANESKIIYSPSIGVGFRIGANKAYASIGYTFLNFRGVIEKHKPLYYKEHIPSQDAGLLFNFSYNIPIIR